MRETSQTPVESGTHAKAQRNTLRAIAISEALKGFAALVAIVGIVNLMHRDVRQLALELIDHFHVSPSSYYPSMMLHYADLLPGANLQLLIALAIGYISLRMTQAYGLWRDRAWAEWLAALSGGLYIPFEIQHFIERPTLINGGVWAINIAVVSFLAYRLWQRRKCHG